MKSVAVIGSGFSGLSAACYAAGQGYDVTVFEKNKEIGGRARSFSEKGFLFDMGPSWYWMPDVFEKFFRDFGTSSDEQLHLIKLDPAFQVIFKDQSPLIVPSEIPDLLSLFETIEKGSAEKLKRFLKDGERKYQLAMSELIYKPSLAWSEFISPSVIAGMLRSRVLSPMSRHVRSYFKDERLIRLMEFPVIFLGAMPDKIPALYSLMNYAAFNLGTWYPMGGMTKVTQAMQRVAMSKGVQFRAGEPIEKIHVSDSIVSHVSTHLGNYKAEAVISAADYHHTENFLLDEGYRNYSENYWEKQVMAPSCLLFFVGVNKKIEKLLHHNLFFDSDFEKHSSEIYTTPQWPDDPLFYVCCPSKTDPEVAPDGSENLFILIPLASGLKDNEKFHDAYFDMVITRIEKHCGTSIKENVVYKKNYCLRDFKKDYNAFKGNAYGLANTLRQTAVFKPSVKNRKVENLFYAGQLTVPGPGVPPAIISGQIAASLVKEYLK